MENQTENPPSHKAMVGKEKLWFKRKRYGWGWQPATWEGWLITVLYIAGILVFAFEMEKDAVDPNVFTDFVLPVIVLTVLMVWISYKKGEKPRWNWGGKSISSSKGDTEGKENKEI